MGLKVLTAYLDRPGYCLDKVATFLEQEHEVIRITSPVDGRKRSALRGFFGASPKVDVAITTEPLTFLHLLFRRKDIRKLIFWRIDYRAGRNIGMNGAADAMIRHRADEIWSIVRSEREGEKYVPFLLGPEDFMDKKAYQPRVVFSGPKTSTEYSIALEGANLAGVNLVSTNWREGPKQPLTDQELRELFSTSIVGLALYNPRRGDKWKSDPGRVKSYLAAGLPVIATNSFPFASEMASYGAGEYVAYSPEGVAAAIKKITDNYEFYSGQAKLLAKKYEVSKEWIQL